MALLVQHAHSGSLDGTGHPDPVLGAYGGELKPSKKATAGTGASAVKLSAVAVSSAVERYQGRVLVSPADADSHSSPSVLQTDCLLSACVS